MSDKEFKNDALRRQMQLVLAEETVKFLEENRDTVVKRAEQRLKDEQQNHDTQPEATELS